MANFWKPLVKWLSMSESLFPNPEDELHDIHVADTVFMPSFFPLPLSGNYRIQASSINILTLLIYQISIEVNSIDLEHRQVLVSNPSTSIKLSIWPWKNYLISALSFLVRNINIMIVSTYWRFNELNTIQKFAHYQAYGKDSFCKSLLLLPFHCYYCSHFYYFNYLQGHN